MTDAIPSARRDLPDHASDRDDRGLPIDRVGIRGLTYPIRVLDKNHEAQATVAEIGLYVSLPAHQKGTHMSRLVEVLHSVRGELTIRNMPTVLAEIQRRLEAEDAFMDVAFPYFIEKHAPVSGVPSLMSYQCAFHGARRGEQSDFVLEVKVPVKTLCPCSKAISERGAHNQRSEVTVRMRASSFVWIEDLVAAVEGVASAPLYALLKREDEKHVTEQAYDNPRFAEDLVRDAVLALRAFEGVSWLHVSVDNAESIHNHAAWAELTWSEDDDAGPALIDLPSLDAPAAHTPPFSFGGWLRGLRERRQLSQGALAEQLDVSPSYLSRVESGDKPLSEEAAGRLSAVLGLDPAKVLLRSGHVPEALMAHIQRDPEGFLKWTAGHTDP